ncbi:amino acid adenylation domain-containing protein [Photobacterium frigidiphilum]|uniref:amino acid adenylation domain-containing protein n=1 Tax=Photobacterium frigidiphilum TaxID=264736 RepID=UPI00267E87BE|nr:amino acid adenylation domain-containing protein [Photobacterium frigidiphilum]
MTVQPMMMPPKAIPNEAMQNKAMQNKAEQNKVMPLNTAQQGLWLGHTLNENKALFNTAECIAFEGRVDSKQLVFAIEQAVKESECLYCHFVEGEDQTPYIHPAQCEVPITTHVLTSKIIDIDEEREEVKAWAQHDIALPLDLSHGLPCRFTILHGATNDYLYNCVHHIALDGFGTTLMFQRIAEIYTARIAEKVVSPNPFGAFDAVLDEDMKRVTSGTYAKAKNFWLETLETYPQPSSYSDKVAPITADFYRTSAGINATVWKSLTTICEANKLTWADVFLAVLCAHLKQQTGDNAIMLGMMVMNRLGSKSLTVPSMQMNIVPLVMTFDPQDDLISSAKKIAQHKKTMRRFQHYRYEDLRRDLHRIGGEQRLFGALVNIMPFDHPLHYGNLAAQTLNLSAGPVEDITIELHSKTEGLPSIDFDANPDVYSWEQLSTLQNGLLTLIAQWVTEPSLTVDSLLDRQHADARLSALIKGTDATQLPSIHGQVIERINEQALLYPNNVAIEQQTPAGLQQTTYQQLISLSQQAAWALKQQGVQRGDRVAVAMSRSVQQVIAQLAVMHCGAVYVPLDPEQPMERQQSIVKQANIQTLITEAEYQHALTPLAIPTMLLAGHLLSDGLHYEPMQYEPMQYKSMHCEPVLADDVAYVMFTSGSTGEPKGVEISHGALNHFSAAGATTYGITTEDRVLQFAPFNFDASIEEVFVTLTQGATLILRTDAMLESMPAFVDAIEQADITVLDLPTAFWNEWVVSLHAGVASIPTTLQHVIIGGEAVYPEQLAQWQTAVAQAIPVRTISLFNTYGPTESTVVATSCDLQAQSSYTTALPIGLPLPGVNALILDHANQPANIGELVLLGPTLAQGYIGLTHPAFTTMLIGEAPCRAYRTGDRVTFLDGQIVYLGRIDNEFKISGYRIQPGEVESHLLALNTVTEASVQGVVYPNGIRRLIAFIAVPENVELDVKDIKQQLSEHLPPAMIPTDYRFFNTLPKTTSNKVDRKALLASYDNVSTEVALATETEQRVSTIWQQILGVSGLHSQANFFELGGQSLQTIQIVNRLAAEFGVTVKVSDVFDHPVLSEFCQYLDVMQVQSEDEVEMVW